MKKRPLAIGMATTLGIAASGVPASAISEAGCEGLAKAQGFITIDLRGSALDELFAEVNEAISGEGPPEIAIFVPRVRLRDDCKPFQLP